MFLYNITIIIDDDIREEALGVIESQLFGGPEPSPKLLELLDTPHEGATYCVQLQAADPEMISRFREEQLEPIKQLVTASYHGKIVFFESLMKYIRN